MAPLRTKPAASAAVGTGLASWLMYRPRVTGRSAPLLVCSRIQRNSVLRAGSLRRFANTAAIIGTESTLGASAPSKIDFVVGITMQFLRRLGVLDRMGKPAIDVLCHIQSDFIPASFINACTHFGRDIR